MYVVLATTFTGNIDVIGNFQTVDDAKAYGDRRLENTYKSFRVHTVNEVDAMHVGTV